MLSKLLSRKFTILFLIVSVLYTFFLSPDELSKFDNVFNFKLILIVLVNVFLHFLTEKKTYKNWLRYDVLFILGFLIVHFQIPFLASLGVEPERPNSIWVNKFVVNYATWFSVLVILIWLLGYRLFLPKKINKNKNYRIKFPAIDFLMKSSFLLFIFLVGSEFLGGSYTGTRNWQFGSTYIYLVLKISLYLSIIYFFINNSHKLVNFRELIKVMYRKKFLFIISIIYTIIFLGAGDRGPVMQIGLVFLGCYTLFYKKISLPKILLLIFLGASLFTIIRFGRTSDASQRQGNIITEGYTNFTRSDNSFNPTNELASSVKILYQALNLVPESHPYLYGTTIGSNIVDVIPFGGSFLLEAVSVPVMYTNSTKFFTIIEKGVNYKFGEGSEIIADLYINFGFWVTLIIFLFFGRFISYITFQSHFNKNHRIYIIYLLLLISALYVNRANFLQPLKIIVWALVFDRLLTKKIKL